MEQKTSGGSFGGWVGLSWLYHAPKICAFVRSCHFPPSEIQIDLLLGLNSAAPFSHHPKVGAGGPREEGRASSSSTHSSFGVSPLNLEIRDTHQIMDLDIIHDQSLNLSESGLFRSADDIVLIYASQPGSRPEAEG